MALPVEINPLQLKTSGGYSVSKSLRFRSSASAYLNRTPATATNRKTWTWSGWVKLGTLSVARVLFGAGQNATTGIDFGFQSDNTFFYAINGVGSWSTTAVFRDPSAWYHVVFAFDSTQATQANRSIVYINGVNYAFSSNGVVLNNNYDVNNNIAQYFGYTGVSGTPQYLDGYMAEVNFIDGQALAASSFGTYDANGVWQPIKYSGTYGTNGFYLNFGNTTSTTTLGYDTSGNNNNWTTNNISLTAGSTYDSMNDSPTVTSATVANYATLNPVGAATYASLTSANLKLTGGGSTWNNAPSTIAPTSGKWYYEVTTTSWGTTTYSAASVYQAFVSGNLAGSTSSAPGWTAQLATSGNSSYFNANAATAVNMGSWVAGDICNVAIDISAGKIWFGRNGVWYNISGTTYTNTDVAAGNGYAFNNLATNTPTYMSGAVYNVSGNVIDLNFGQRPFSYTPPTGFNALNTYNLPTPTIANGAQYMAATTYTGTGASGNAVSNATNNTIGTTFQPDFVWIKSRSLATTDHALSNVVAGFTLGLSSNNTGAEFNQSSNFTSVGATGFTVQGTSTSYNQNAATYVGWQWKANGAGVTNTNGSITSTVSANTTAGFSIVTYTGTGANATVGHGLGVAPSMVIVKLRSSAQDWVVWQTALAGTEYLLFTTAAKATGATFWNSTTPTSTVFSIGSSGATNSTSGTYVAYCWSAVPGYSAFGSYTGNGSADGPFVYTGFRPRFILTKRTDAVNTWELYDTSRSAYNAATAALYPNTSAAETTDDPVDILSNGFKMRASGNAFNTSGGTYIYAAFAENPFQNSRAR